MHVAGKPLVIIILTRRKVRGLSASVRKVGHRSIHPVSHAVSVVYLKQRLYSKYSRLNDAKNKTVEVVISDFCQRVVENDENILNYRRRD